MGLPINYEKPIELSNVLDFEFEMLDQFPKIIMRFNTLLDRPEFLFDFSEFFPFFSDSFAISIDEISSNFFKNAVGLPG